MRKALFLLFLFIMPLAILSQKKIPYKFGSITQADFDLNVYEKDSSANAVFLYEYGKTKFFDSSTYVIIQTKYYAKIKIFNKEGVDHATVSIPIYKNDNAKEKVIDIKAITHNGIVKTSLAQKDIFTEKINEHWSEVKFTMPNIKDNSIIEYQYTFETPFKFNFKGWNFQEDIPKIHSEFFAMIPGNYVYNRRLIGYHKFSKNSASIKKKCFQVSGYSGESDCEVLTYAMSNIPAFIEEDYMTTKDNYIASIKFELSEFKGFNGIHQKYTKSWKDVDKEFKIDKDIGKQLKKVDYIKKQLPISLIEGETNLVKAKKIYNYIQNHFSWHPVMSDFNYAIGKLTIDGNSFLLDATSRTMPFGMLPYRCLNGYGRVMNFKKSSYWHNIIPKKNNLTRTLLNLKMDDEGNFNGQMQKSFNGYKAINTRIEINNLDEDTYLTKVEETYGSNDQLIINSYKNSGLKNVDKPLNEIFDITIENNLNGKLLILNPFITTKIPTNPFKLSERSYPIDFGYGRSNQYLLQLEIPKNYIVKSLPKKVGFRLPDNGGSFIFDVQQKDHKINLIFRSSIKRAFFLPEEYPYLKEFYNQIIKTQKSLITLEKIN